MPKGSSAGTAPVYQDLAMVSIKKAVKFSVFVQIVSKGIGLFANIMLIRLLPINIIGGFTLLVSSAQSLSSIARFGTDYNYQITACKLNPDMRGGIQDQFLGWNAFFSAVASILAIPFLLPSLYPFGSSPWLIVVVLIYLFMESYVDVLWEPVLASRDYNQIFGRHLQVAFSKATLPLIFGITYGWKGLVAGLVIATSLNALAAIVSLRRLPYSNGKPLPLKIFFRAGLPFYLVPLIQQLIFWPAILYLGADRGLASIGLLRVAQLVVQVVGVLPASLVPIVFIENAHGSDNARSQLLKGLYAVALSGLAIFAIYILIDSSILPIIFGLEYSNAILPSRAMLLAAVCNGASQIFQQQAFKGKLLQQLSILQVCVLVVLAPIGITWWIPFGGVEGYAWLNLAVSFFTLLALIIWDPNKIMVRREHILIAIIFLLISPFAVIPVHGILAWCLPAVALALVIISSRGLLRFNNWRII
jgi:O-antigen/teichoic acid export membrane protein